MRDGPLKEFLVPIFIKYGRPERVAVEPNTKPPNLTGEESILYARTVRALAEEYSPQYAFEPLPIMQITERTTREMVLDAYALGVRIFKVYPFFVTTNSENGVKDYTKLYPVLKALQHLPGVVVQLHAETPRFEVIGRFKEQAFLKGEMTKIVREVPDLPMTIEHLSSKFGVGWVRKFSRDHRIAASLAIQHMLGTTDDVLGYSWRSGGLMRPHDGFKPHAKDPKDRDAVCEAAFSGEPCFFNSNDDAWHLKSAKHSAGASCGAANTIAAPSKTIELFEKHNALDDKLQPFVCENGPRFYGHEPSTETVRYVRKPSRVPDEMEVPGTGDSVIPWCPGEELQWQIAED